jgi:hypothetical protein
VSSEKGGEGQKSGEEAPVRAKALRRVRKSSEGEVESGGERGDGGGKGADPEEGFRAGEPNEGARVGSEHEGEEGAVREGGR